MSEGLKFPFSRLLIQTLMAEEHLSGAEAIRRAALEYALIDKDCTDGANLVCTIIDCKCGQSALTMLRSHFGLRKHLCGTDIADVIWIFITARSQAFADDVAKAAMPEADFTKNLLPCHKFAPIIFDLMLQEVQRYA